MPHLCVTLLVLVLPSPARSIILDKRIFHDLSPLVNLSLQVNSTWKTAESLPVWDDSQIWMDDPRFPSLSMLQDLPPFQDFKAVPESRLLIHPAKKLAFCYIEKNACTQFNYLFNELNGLEWQDVPWWRSTLPAFNISMEQISRDEGWKWAVFLRDPLPRYLSAWGSKCVQQEDGGSNCVPKDLLSEGSPQDFEDHVLANSMDSAAREANPHWAQQQAFCGGLRNATDYDFVGHLRGDVNKQVRAMLAMVNASQDAVEEFFPSLRVAGHTSGIRPSTYYKNETVQRVVMEMYAEDYWLPGLKPHLIAANGSGVGHLIAANGSGGVVYGEAWRRGVGFGAALAMAALLA